MKITDVDKNFRQSNPDCADAVFYDVKKEPFSIHGVFYDGDKFKRIPEKVAQNTNDGVKYLNQCTAGGRVRFVTDSPYVAVFVKYAEIGKMPHFALSGSVGLDLYSDGIYCGTFIPPYDLKKKKFGGKVWLAGGGKHEITVNMPSYSGVCEMLIGLKKDSVPEKAPDYKYTQPVVFYGSSITQGGCCSRPGNTYQQILSNRLGFDYINLGFSGSAKGEQAISDYIAALDMSAFVYDYDHNAPDAEHLRATHEKLFLNFRRSHPETPVLMLSRPKKHLDPDEIQRREIVKKTYENALARGDKNVYFIPGDELISDNAAEYALVDNCHPNDIGFLSMANAVESTIKLMLEK